MNRKSPHLQKKRILNEISQLSTKNRGEGNNSTFTKGLGYHVGNFIGRTWVGEDSFLTGEASKFTVIASSPVLRVVEINCETALRQMPTQSLHALSMSFIKKREFMVEYLEKMEQVIKD